MAPVQFLTKVFNVRPGEGRILTALLIHSLFLGIGTIFFYSAASALFLVKFDVEALPYAYICSAFIAPVMGLLFFKLQENLPANRLFAITLGFILGSICFFRVILVLSDSRWPVFSLIVWAHVLFVIGNLEFWGLAGRCFNVRQGKRLFGLIGTGEVSAIIIAGFAVPAIVEIVGTPNLLIGSAVGVGLCLVVLAFIFRLFPDWLEEENSTEEEQKKETDNILRDLRKDRYMSLISVLWALSTFGFFFIDFAFFQQAETRYTNEDQLAKFFGILLAIAGVATLLSRMFVSGQLLNRFGLTAGLLALPVMLTLGSGSIVMGYFIAGAGVIFWLVMMTRVFDEVARTSIEEPSKRVLYQPLPVDKRLSLQTLVEGLVEPVAGGLAGVVLLLLTKLLDFQAIHAAFILICIGTIWIGVVLALSKEYKKALLEALSKRTLGDVKVSLIDASSVEVLKKGLSHSNPGVIAYCLNMLQEMEHPLLETYLVDLLDNSHSQIRLEALQRIETLKVRSALDRVRERVENEEITRVKGVALRVLCELDQNFSYEKMAPYLADADSEIRKGVIVGLLRNGGTEEVRFAEGHLMESVQSQHWEHRLFAAQVLEETEIPAFHKPLNELLNDENIPVQKAALKACGRLKISRLWPRVLESLQYSQTRTAAFSALVSGGESALPFLEEKFIENDPNHEFLIQVVRIFGQIGGDSALGFLAKNLSYPVEEVRHQLLHSLARFNYQALEDGKKEVLRSIDYEIENATWTLAALADISKEDRSEILRRALQYSLLQNQERVLLLLSFIYPSREIHRIRANLVHSLVEQRAYALEALEHVVPTNIKKSIFPLLDDLPPEESLQQLSSRFPQERLTFEVRLAKIISRPLKCGSTWTKSCALYLAGKTSTFNHYDVIIDSLSSPIPLMQETAAWALYSLNSELFKKYGTRIKRVASRSQTILSKETK